MNLGRTLYNFYRKQDLGETTLQFVREITVEYQQGGGASGKACSFSVTHLTSAISRRLPSLYARFARAPRRVVSIAWMGPVQQGKLSISNGSGKIDSSLESPHRYFRWCDPDRAGSAQVWPRENCINQTQQPARWSIYIYIHAGGVHRECELLSWVTSEGSRPRTTSRMLFPAASTALGI